MITVSICADPDHIKNSMHSHNMASVGLDYKHNTFTHFSGFSLSYTEVLKNTEKNTEYEVKQFFFFNKTCKKENDKQSRCSCILITYTLTSPSSVFKYSRDVALRFILSEDVWIVRAKDLVTFDFFVLVHCQPTWNFKTIKIFVPPCVQWRH